MKMSGVVGKLESIFKLHSRLNFSLLLCQCFEKSKLCLKNLTYAYICMKVYNLAGRRETSITVRKRQRKWEDLVSYRFTVVGRPGNFLAVASPDLRPVEVASSPLCFSLCSLHLHSPVPFVSLQAHGSEPGLPLVLKSILPHRAYIFLFVAVITERMSLTPSGDRVGFANGLNRVCDEPPPQ